MIDQKKAKTYLSEICQNLPQDYKEEGTQGKLLSWAVCSLSFQNKQPTAFFLSTAEPLREIGPGWAGRVPINT